MGVSDTTEKDWEEHYKEYSIPQSLLNTLADINVDEINSHIYSAEKLYSWLCSWHEKIKQELYDFANKPSGCRYYVDNHCNCMSREDELEEELRFLRFENLKLQNLVLKMCYEKYGE